MNLLTLEDEDIRFLRNVEMNLLTLEDEYIRFLRNVEIKLLTLGMKTLVYFETSK